MATREITQIQDRFTGDVNKIRDEKIATASNASGASDMTSQCEFLIKNGQTGEFMNFLKSYIDESVRNALGALVNNLDKGTSIKSVLATDADNDLGSTTPANLASVLSAPLCGNILRIKRITAMTNGKFRIDISGIVIVKTIYNGCGIYNARAYEVDFIGGQDVAKFDYIKAYTYDIGNVEGGVGLEWIWHIY